MTTETLHTASTSEAATHSWPHIFGVKGEVIGHIFGFPVTTTVFSTWMFMIFLFVLVGIFYIAIKTNKFSKIRTFGLDVVKRLDDVLTDDIGKKKYARVYFPLLGGLFAFILLSNFFGLLLDYLGIVSPVLHHYLRPFNADMATTLSMAVAVILITHISGMFHKWVITHWKHYIFNFSGDTFVERIINVPVGWIHLLGEFTRILSLSVRLFANIFAGAALIAVVVYLGSIIPIPAIGHFLMIPVWMFELLVACIQAFIFFLLSTLYIKESMEYDSH